MVTSASLYRIRLAGRLCRLGAWIIAAAGLAVIVCFVIVSAPNNQGDSGQNLNNLLQTSAIALLVAIPVFFFFLILYAVGTFLDYISSEKKTLEADDERVEITSLPETR